MSTKGVEFQIDHPGRQYLVVGGLPVPRADHAQAVASMALDAVSGLNRRHGWEVSFRIGVNSGPVMAAVVGRHRFPYDVWSDTVNSASRMESSGAPGRIQVTEETYRRRKPIVVCFRFTSSNAGVR